MELIDRRSTVVDRSVDISDDRNQKTPVVSAAIVGDEIHQRLAVGVRKYLGNVRQIVLCRLKNSLKTLSQHQHQSNNAFVLLPSLCYIFVSFMSVGVIGRLTNLFKNLFSYSRVSYFEQNDTKTYSQDSTFCSGFSDGGISVHIGYRPPPQ